MAKSSTSGDELVDDDTRAERRPRRGRRAVWITLAVLVVLAGGVYLTGYFATGDRTPANASVHGIAIGGLSRAEAEQRLTDELGPQAEQPFTLVVDGERSEVTPAELGMSVDIAESVANSGVGRSFDPTHMWRVFTGGEDQPPAVVVDEQKLAGAVAAMAEQTDQEAADATVGFADGKAAITPARSSKTLDQQQAQTLIRQSYLVRTEVVLPVATQEPAITDADAAAAAAFAQAATSGPVTVRVANTDAGYAVPVATIVAAYSFVDADGTLQPVLDQEKLWSGNAEAIAQLPVTKATDARVEIRDGSPTVIPSRDGTEITKEAFLKAVPPVIGKTGEQRVAVVTPTGAKPKYTTADAEKAGVKEVVGSFTTPFPYAEYRNTNLSVAAGLMNNTFLAPGEQFSLNGEIGPRSRSQGFIDGYFIEGGILKQGLAGGISQSATTVYNAAFFAGLQIDQHQPHTLYFSRYPAGRESTVYYPSIDVKFTNDTPYGVVVQAFVNKAAPGGTGEITVRIWSTKYYTVESAEPTKSGFYSGKVRYIDDPKCEYQAPIQGFTARYNRVVRKLDGSVHRNEQYSWKYSAGDEIRCGKPPRNDDEDDEDD